MYVGKSVQFIGMLEKVYSLFSCRKYDFRKNGHRKYGYRKNGHRKKVAALSGRSLQVRLAVVTPFSA